MKAELEQLSPKDRDTADHSPTSGGQVLFYQIYFKEEQKQNMWPFSIPYFNDELTIFFENAVIQKLVTETKADKIAVCSWKLKDKLQWNLATPRRPNEITEEVINREYDVLPFTRNSKHHQMLAAANGWHPGFKEAMTRIVEGIGKLMPSEVKIPIYQNAFSAKREIYQDYVTDYLTPAMELIKNDPEIYKIATVDSHYTKLMREDCASAEYLQEKIGFPYYPLSTFLLERLFSIYVHNKKVNVTFL